MFKVKPFLKGLLAISLMTTGCKVPALMEVNENRNVPANYETSPGSTVTPLAHGENFLLIPTW